MADVQFGERDLMSQKDRMARMVASVLRRPYVWGIAVLALPALVTGCGSGGAADEGRAGESAAAGAITGGRLEIVSKAFSYEPSTITVTAGDRATLSLQSKDLPHDVTVEELGIELLAEGGETVEKGVVFERPGTYTFFCSIAGHREAGMVGTLVVQ